MNMMKTMKVVRYITHGLGSAMLLLFFTFLIGEGILGDEGPPPIFTPAAIAVELMLLGLMIAWKWHGIGGSMVIFGYMIFAYLNQKLLLNTPFVMFPIIGCSYVLCWMLTRTVEQKSLNIQINDQSKRSE